MMIVPVYRDGYARRVVPIDPLVNKRLEQVTSVAGVSEDDYLACEKVYLERLKALGINVGDEGALF